MKSFNFKQIAFIIIGALCISLSAISCSKSSVDRPGGIPADVDYGTHYVDPQLQGKWMWTDGSDVGNWDDNGVFQGGGYGFAIQVSVDSKGNGTWFQHIFSDPGGSYFGVDISYYGYYEMDNQGNLTFYPMGGRYKTSDGTDRSLRSDELYHTSDGSGRTLSLPAINFTTQGGRACFTSTSSDTETDVFFKL